MEAPTLPVAGVAIALVTGIVLLFTGIDLLIVLGIVLVWCLSLWLAFPPPKETAAPIVEGVQLTQSGMRDLIEHSGLPVMMLDRDRIIAANAAAREAIGEHVIGQDARVALRHPAAVDLLSRRGAGTVNVQGLTGPRSNWQMTRQPIDERYCLIELVNRTAEADVSRAHTDFVANASHELRTPLASIIGYMETLADEGDQVPPSQVSRFYETVLREARRLQSLVNDLMSLSRVEAEKHDQPRKRIDLAHIVLQSSRDTAGLYGIERLQFDIPDGEVPIRGDERQIEQLVRNLADNALKYGADTEKVRISLSLGERDMAVLTFEDRGEGIAPEHIPHLTRRFYRTDPSRSRAAGGTGLGLAIVKHIVERHRGRLDISSVRGTGTTVTVRIPLLIDQANTSG